MDQVVDMPAGVRHHGVVEVPQLQFIDKISSMAVGTSVYGGFDAFFLSPQALTAVTARGLQVLESRGFYSQVTRPVSCTINGSFVVAVDILLNARVRNNNNSNNAP